MIDKRLASEINGSTNSEPKIVEYARAFFPVLLIVFLLRAFVTEPYRIPSGSMKPTLLAGDFILVNKFSYGIRLPIIGTTVFKTGVPKRGDIMVFRFPKDPSINFIKRIVGQPGDKISYKNKQLFINGNKAPTEYLERTSDVGPRGFSRSVNRYNEQLNGVTHSIFLTPEIMGSNAVEITVPQGHYFVLGDNRDNSEDSRVWGFVPDKLILGKAYMIWLSWDSFKKDVRWERFGKNVSKNT